MKARLENFPLVSSVALTGGRAPSCWQRELGRRTTRLVALQRMCAWVQTLGAVQPRLRQEKLFGRCLETLIESGAPAAQTESETPPSRRPAADFFNGRDRVHARPNFAPCDQRLKPGAMPKPAAPRSCEKPAVLPVSLQLERQANRDLLQCLAGDNAARASNVSPSNRRHPAKAQNAASPGAKQFSPGAPENKRKQSLGVLPEVNAETAARKNGLHEAGQRVERLLRRDVAPDFSNATSGVEAEKVIAPWAVLLNGPAASIELLDSLLGHHGAGHREARSSASATRRSRTSSRDSADQAKAAPVSRHQQQTPSVSSSRVHDLRNDGVNAREPLPLPVSWPETGSPARPLSMRDEEKPPSPLAKMILPNAGPEARATTEDDLNQLAAKIKRILDEEARRHGIEV
jgi:hypothetical protein